MTREERLQRDGAVDPVLFYGGPFSNFSPHPVSLRCPWTRRVIVYPTGEARFQALKATKITDHEYVSFAPTPSEAKRRGRQIELRSDWGSDLNTICWYVMLETVLAKALQHDDVLSALRETDMRVIYEDSPTDDIWGWRHGQDHSGKNLLGRCWMQAREMLA